MCWRRKDIKVVYSTCLLLFCAKKIVKRMSNFARAELSKNAYKFFGEVLEKDKFCGKINWHYDSSLIPHAVLNTRTSFSKTQSDW